MKLRTKIDQNRLVAEHVYVDTENVEWFQSPDICHDAAYAHALVRALDWMKSEYHNQIHFMVAIEMLRGNADGRMAELGYMEEAWALQKT